MENELLGRRHVEFNGIFMPANAAVQHARRACVPLHAKTNYPDWPISNMGSGFLYARNDRKFVVFTRHQLGKDKRPSQVMVRLGPASSSRLYSGARFVHFPNLQYGPEEYDVCAIEMPWGLSPNIGAPLFIKSIRSIPLCNDNSERYFTVGYPSKLTRMDGEIRSEHIGLMQVLVWAQTLTQNLNDLPMLQLMPGEVMTPKCNGDFDGFSGGPVFGVNKNTHLLSLRGIVLRGGIDKLFFVPTDWINQVCDKALAEPKLEEFAA